MLTHNVSWVVASSATGMICLDAAHCLNLLTAFSGLYPAIMKAAINSALVKPSGWWFPRLLITLGIVVAIVLPTGPKRLETLSNGSYERSGNAYRVAFGVQDYDGMHRI